MSFFKKLAKDFENLKADLLDDKDKRDKNKPENVHGHEDPKLNQSSDIHQPQTSQYPPYNTQQQQPPYQNQHPPIQQHGYPGPAPTQLPPGWTAQFDQNSQRWFYLDQSTGRTQWEPPMGNFSGPPPPMGGHSYGGYDHSGVGAAEHKKSGHGGAVVAGAGGLVVGAVGGALLSNALDGSDDEHHNVATDNGGAAPAPGYGGPGPEYAAPPPVAPENNPNLSSSERSSIKSAREDLDEAREEYAASSSPSSSDREELAEAQEEYNEEVVEAYDD